MPGLSIVIPCLGSAAEFDGTLVSVLQNRPADCEVLVVHSQTYADPYALAGEVRFLEVPTTSIVELLNKALHEAGGDVLHIVGCGLEVEDGWTTAAMDQFHDPEIAAVSPIVLSPDRTAIVSAGIRWSPAGLRHVVCDERVIRPGSGRLRAKILGPSLTAAFYRRDVLAAMGGFDPSAGAELADVAAGLAIQSLGKLHVCEPASQLVQMHPRFDSSGGFSRGRAAERLFWRTAGHYGLAVSLALHPLAILQDCFEYGFTRSTAASLLGRAASWLEFGAVQRHRQQLAKAATCLAELADLRATMASRSKLKSARYEIPPAPQRRAA